RSGGPGPPQRPRTPTGGASPTPCRTGAGACCSPRRARARRTTARAGIPPPAARAAPPPPRRTRGGPARAPAGVGLGGGRGAPLDFRLGVGQVISGWDQGVQGMKVGGRRQLVIPPHLGYGDRGAGGVIKPGETLIFVVDLLDVR